MLLFILCVTAPMFSFMLLVAGLKAPDDIQAVTQFLNCLSVALEMFSFCLYAQMNKSVIRSAPDLCKGLSDELRLKAYIQLSRATNGLQIVLAGHSTHVSDDSDS